MGLVPAKRQAVPASPTRGLNRCSTSESHTHSHPMRSPSGASNTAGSRGSTSAPLSFDKASPFVAIFGRTLSPEPVAEAGRALPLLA